MTVLELKDRLRQMNLSVGGRKQELIDRLNEHYFNNPLSDDADDVGSSEDDYNSLTVPVLKQRLKTLGLPLTGRKDDLIQRLRGQAKPQESPIIDAAESSIDHTDDGTSFFDETEMNQDELSNEDPKSRRARRKKYFKTQEVRELIRSNDPRAPQKAEEMIATLELMAKEEKDDEYLPGPKQYTTLIDAYAKSNTRSAEAVIERIMKSNLVLTTTMMNAIMGAYVNMGTLEGAKEASIILERMEYTRDFGSGAVKPTVYSYSLAITAWAKCCSMEAAISASNILTRLLESYEKISMNNNDDEYLQEMKPNSVVFNGVIDAW
jgi:hypothetical protein